MAYFCLFFILITLLAPKTQAVWDEPSAVPPNDNIYGVLTIGPDDQAKGGTLLLGDIGTASGNYILEVADPGAQINDLNVNGVLSVDDLGGSYNFVVDPANKFVNIGNLIFGGLDIKLGVAGNISVGYKDGSSDDSIPGRAIQGLSSNDYGVYGIGHGAGNAGVYGENNGTDNCDIGGCYGVAGVAVDNVGIMGESPSGISVLGESLGTGAKDYGIYAENKNPLGKWAGYFQGKIQSTDEIVGTKFLPTKLQNSLIPYVSGFKVADYQSGLVSNANKAFDGTNIWSVGNSGGNGYVSKVRVSDGFRIFNATIGTEPSDLVFDGNYIWVTDRSEDRVRKINPDSRSEDCSTANISQPVSAVFDGTDIWVSSYNNIITKIDASTCSQTGFGQIDLGGILASSGLGKIIFDGDSDGIGNQDFPYVWVTYNDNDDDTNNDAIIRIDEYGNYVIFTGLPKDEPFNIFFDGFSYWVTSVEATAGGDTYYLTKFFFREGMCDRSAGTCINNSSMNCYVGGIYHDDYCPIIEDYQLDDAGPSFIAFDGTYLWLANIGAQSLTRVLAADPTERESYSLGFEPKGLTFDGTYLWIGNDTYGLSKYYTGTGWGQTDLSMALTLQDNDPLIPQEGNFNISDPFGISSTIGQNMNIGGDLSVLNNQWGTETGGDVKNVGASQTVECPEGHFIKNIVADASGVVSEIQCRPL